MRFDTNTLRITANAFSAALKSSGLSLPHSTELNIWSNLVIGKYHSASVAQIKAEGPQEAARITPKTLQDLLAKRRRTVSPTEALDIIVESLSADLQRLSPCMAGLLGELCKDSQSCLSETVEPTMGIGFFTAGQSGYLPAGNIPRLRPFFEEFAWIKQNNKLVIDVLNRLSKRNGEDYAEIMVSSIRASEGAKDKALNLFLTRNASQLSEAIASALVGQFEFESWSFIDYADIRHIAVDCLETSTTKAKDRLLTPHCSLGELVIDHISGRLWDDTQCFGNAGELPDDLEPKELLEETAALAISRILRPVG